MRISDWSSDVCSSDLAGQLTGVGVRGGMRWRHVGSGLLGRCRVPDMGAGGGKGKPGRKAGGDSSGQAGADRLDPCDLTPPAPAPLPRSEEHTSELQYLMRLSYAVFCLPTKKTNKTS